MATEEKKSGSNTGLIIAGVLVVLTLGGIFLVPRLLKKSPSLASGADGTGVPAPVAGGNDYVSGAAIAKRKSSNYNGWGNGKSPDYNSYWGAIMKTFGDDLPTGSDGKPVPGAHSENEIYTSAFLKGMNLAPRADYVAIFKNYIQEYIDNPARIPHWETTNGQFLKA